jgi:hypothetical protein
MPLEILLFFIPSVIASTFTLLVVMLSVQGKALFAEGVMRFLTTILFVVFGVVISMASTGAVLSLLELEHALLVPFQVNLITFVYPGAILLINSLQSPKILKSKPSTFVLMNLNPIALFALILVPTLFFAVLSTAKMAALVDNGTRFIAFDVFLGRIQILNEPTTSIIKATNFSKVSDRPARMVLSSIDDCVFEFSSGKKWTTLSFNQMTSVDRRKRFAERLIASSPAVKVETVETLPISEIK